MFLEGSVVQRLQRFTTYGDLKQLILMKVSEELMHPGIISALLKYRQKCKGFVAADANTVLLEDLKHLFDALDTDNSGAISTDELADGKIHCILEQRTTERMTGLRAQGYFVSDDEARQLLSKIDVDKSGYIDFDEFMATLVDWSEVRIIPSIVCCFLTDVCVLCYVQIENNHSEWSIYLDKIFANIDKDGNGFISLDELIDYIPPNTNPQRLSDEEIEARARLMLREADKNKDGQISKEEFYELMQNTVVPDALEQYESRIPGRVK